MADNAWRKLAQKVKAKRAKKVNPRFSNKVNNNEIVVQRLSADVSGKVQKYSRIGLYSWSTTLFVIHK